MGRKILQSSLSGQENSCSTTHRSFLKYHNGVWNLELAVQQIKNTFEIGHGNSIEKFLDSMYLAGSDIGGSKLENYTQSIERSNKMLKLLNSAVDAIRSKHKHENNTIEFYITVIYPGSNYRMQIK